MGSGEGGGGQFYVFPFVSLDDIAVKKGSTFERNNCFKGSIFLFEELTPIEKAGRNENGRVASPKRVPTRLA